MKILLVNSAKPLFEAASESLKDTKFRITESSGPARAIDEIKEAGIQIVVINSTSSPAESNQLCSKIKKLRLASCIYVLSIISREQHKEINELISTGADDFIIKPFSKEEFYGRIRIAEKIVKTENSNSKSNKKLIKLAKEDPLTNLFNRRSLLDEVLKEMGRASRDMKYLSSILAGIRNFNDIVEKHGSLVGDIVIIEFTKRLKASCRPYDKLGRYSFSDFMVFLPDTGNDNATRVAERIVKLIEEKPFTANNLTIEVEVCIGIAELDPDDISKTKNYDDMLMNDLILDAMLRRTETAKEKAAEKGKNIIEIFKYKR